MAFKFLTLEDRLRIEERKNKILQAQLKEAEDALIELAEIVASNAEVLTNG